MERLFDQLSRRLAAGMPRRGSLVLMIQTAAAGFLAACGLSPCDGTTCHGTCYQAGTICCGDTAACNQTSICCNLVGYSAFCCSANTICCPPNGCCQLGTLCYGGVCV